MVATSGSGWVLAPCLTQLIEETDRLFPGRDTTSDGSVGDAAHASRVSDHNPDGGYVRAVDVTDDDAHGCDVSVLIHHLVATRDHRVKYLIHKGTIWKSYPNNGLPAWTPQPYSGLSPHLHHAHVSVLDGHENDRGTWWPQSKPTPPPIPPEEDDMPLIIKANGQPARLFDPPVFVPIDGASATALKAAGVKEVVVTVGDYMEIRDQILKALD